MYVGFSNAWIQLGNGAIRKPPQCRKFKKSDFEFMNHTKVGEKNHNLNITNRFVNKAPLNSEFVAQISGHFNIDSFTVFYVIYCSGISKLYWANLAFSFDVALKSDLQMTGFCEFSSFL